MEAACLDYGVDARDGEADDDAQWMRVASDGSLMVELGGDQETVPPLDPAVAGLARRIFHRMHPLSPQDVYRQVMDATPPPASLLGAGDNHDSDAVAVVAAAEWRLTQMEPRVVQDYASEPEAPQVGYPKTSLAFPTRRHARLARAVFGRHQRGRTARDVVEALRRASLGGGARPCVRAAAAPTLEWTARATDVDATVPTAAWERLLRCVRGAAAASSSSASLPGAAFPADAGACSVDILVDGRCVVGVATVVYFHWRVAAAHASPGRACLVHLADPPCELHYEAAALGAGRVVLRAAWRDRVSAWPWWIADDVRRVPALLLLRPGGRKRARDGDDDEADGDDDDRLEGGGASLGALLEAAADAHPQRGELLRSWLKSFRAPSVVIPRLLYALPRAAVASSTLHESGAPRADGGAALEAVPLTRSSELREWGIVDLLKASLGASYADEMLERAALPSGEDDDGEASPLCLYAVFDADAMADRATPRTARGVFAAVAYACAFSDGTHGVALMIDSFAVSDEHRNAGVGGRAFHRLCRPLAMAHGGPRHVVFAQCLRTGNSTRFWRDKLDDSAYARALLLQAVALTPDLVPPQKCCTPRAREYVG